MTTAADVSTRTPTSSADHRTSAADRSRLALARRAEQARHETRPFGNAKALVCRECGHEQKLGPYFACPECFGPLEVGYDYPRITRDEIEGGPLSIWRYAPLLPVRSDIASIPNTEPGCTRLVPATNLAKALGMKNLWVKDDSGNPTHSFKDRVVAVALAAARELGLRVLACPSTGNLANAVAAAAARAGMESVVLIPHDLEQAKVLTTAVYGGRVVAVRGNYDDVNRLATQIAEEEPGWAFVNVNVRRTTPKAPRRWPSRSPSSSAGGFPGRW